MNTLGLAGSAVGARPSFGTGGRVLVALLCMVLLWRAALFAAAAVNAVNYPWELDYGEGIVWEQMRSIFSASAYGQIDQFPAIVFHYTPLYHAVAHLLAAAFGTDELATGRTVSLVSSLAAAVVSGLIVGELLKDRAGPLQRQVGGCVAALLVFTYLPVVHWAALMRVDMLAIALTLSGFLAALRSIERPVLIHLASVCFVAAVYTKQTSIAAPAAAFGVLLFVRPKLCLQGVLSCTLLGLAVLLILDFLTGGGFSRHIFLYNVNRLDLTRLMVILGLSFNQILYVAAAFAVAGRLAGELAARRRDLADAKDPLSSTDIRLLMALAYLGFTTLLLLLVAKSGSSINYFLEWFFALGLFLGIGAVEILRNKGTTNRPVIVTALPLMLALQAAMADPVPARDAHGPVAKDYALLSAEISKSDKPVISDDMVLLLRSGQKVLWEPAIFAELASTGVWDERPFIERIRKREFEFFVTWKDRGHHRFDERYNPAVADAIAAAYPSKEKLAGLTIHRPAAQPRTVPNP